VAELAELKTAVLREVGKVVVGQDDAVEGMLVALLAQGHVLLEGVPGTAKTLMVRALAASLGLEFGRIQFTPDLMPSDVLGTNVFDFETRRFRLTKGPIFTELLLAD
jgi:MoxR-like ATPase